MTSSTPSALDWNGEMPDPLLRRNAVVKSYTDEYLVILPLTDGYELQVGHIFKKVGAHQRKFWQWAGPGGVGQSQTREAAMVDLKAAWNASDHYLAELRRQQERTERKYALWDAGYRSQLGQDQLRCRCGELFEPDGHEAVRIHIEHIKAPANRGNRRS